MFEPGTILKHYKGGRYLVLTTGRDSEDKKFEVVYQSLDHPTEEPWIRPKGMFTEETGPTHCEDCNIRLQRFEIESLPPEDSKSMTVKQLADRIHTYQQSQLLIAKDRALQYAAILFAKVKGQVNGSRTSAVCK